MSIEFKPKEQFRAMVGVKVTNDEKKEIAQMARSLNLTQSEYIRQLHRNYIKSNAVN